jgi:hypothetical protein
MADPFLNARNQGYSTMGYGVLDAPDTTLAAVTLRAAQGQALSPREARRLATRMAVERETAGLAGQAVGNVDMGVPVSVGGLLAGTKLDRTMGRAAQAEAAMSLNPVLQNARIQQAKLSMLTPTQQNARALGLPYEGLDEQALAGQVADESNVRNYAAQSGLPLSQARVDLTPIEVQPYQAQPLVAPQVPEGADEFQKANATVFKGTETDRFRQAGAEFSKRNAGKVMSLVQLSRARSDFASEAVKPQAEKEVVFPDPKTGLNKSFKVVQDGLGNVLSVSPLAVIKDDATKQLDADFAKDYNEWTSGKAAQSAADLGRLDEAIKRLSGSEQISGPIVGAVTSIPGVQRVANAFMPAVKATETDVLAVGQNQIRTIFGSSPAQAEAQRLLDRIYSKDVTEQENIRRVTVFRDMLQEGAKAKAAKAAYFQQNGTLAGFKGPSETDITSAAAAQITPEDAKAGGPPAARAWITGGK